MTNKDPPPRTAPFSPCPTMSFVETNIIGNSAINFFFPLSVSAYLKPDITIASDDNESEQRLLIPAEAQVIF